MAKGSARRQRMCRWAAIIFEFFEIVLYAALFKQIVMSGLQPVEDNRLRLRLLYDLFGVRVENATIPGFFVFRVVRCGSLDMRCPAATAIDVRKRQ